MPNPLVGDTYVQDLKFMIGDTRDSGIIDDG